MNALDWHSLAYRRLVSEIVLAYKAIFKFIEIDCSEYFKLRNRIWKATCGIPIFYEIVPQRKTKCTSYSMAQTHD